MGADFITFSTYSAVLRNALSLVLCGCGMFLFVLGSKDAKAMQIALGRVAGSIREEDRVEPRGRRKTVASC